MSCGNFSYWSHASAGEVVRRVTAKKRRWEKDKKGRKARAAYPLICYRKEGEMKMYLTDFGELVRKIECSGPVLKKKGRTQARRLPYQNRGKKRERSNRVSWTTST